MCFPFNYIFGEKMSVDIIRELCLAKPHATEDMPFDETTLVFRVGNKMFALTDLVKRPVTVNLKCNPERAIDLREQYEAIAPGWHMNKKHWNTVGLEGDVTQELLSELINHSYDLIYKSLPKKIRTELEEG
jgi:predicted DNA-binding protein (MmcQ/YjbR family)